jgi:hypothetical protein
VGPENHLSATSTVAPQDILNRLHRCDQILLGRLGHRLEHLPDFARLPVVQAREDLATSPGQPKESLAPILFRALARDQTASLEASKHAAQIPEVEIKESLELCGSEIRRIRELVENARLG